MLTREIEKDVLSSFYKYRQLSVPKEIDNYLDSKYPLKDGMWVKHLRGDIVYITDLKKGFGYGNDNEKWDVFNEKGGSTWNFNDSPEYWQPATEKEVIAMLEKEAIRRGYVKGVKVRCFTDINEVINGGSYTSEADLEVGKYWVHSLDDGILIMKNGEWAEIISEPNQEINEQIKKLEKELNELKKLV